MQAKSLILSAVLLILCGCQQPEKVDSFRKISVGNPVPSFGAVSVKGIHFTHIYPNGKFFVHFIDDDLPPMCLDDECGDLAKLVTQEKGHFIGGSDGKYSGNFGINIIPDKEWKFDTSLIVLTDDQGIIEAIYPNAKWKDLKRILILEEKITL